MKKFMLIVLLSLLLAGCGEVVAPVATPTPTLGNGTCNPAPCSQEGTTPVSETPTATATTTATPQAVTHGRPQIGGLLSDFYGKYGKPFLPTGSNGSESWNVSEQPSIAINAAPNGAGRVTHIAIVELDLETGKTWDQAQMTGYCDPFLPDDATQFSRVGDYNTDGLSINYNSSIGEVNELLILGNCTITLVGS